MSRLLPYRSPPRLLTEAAYGCLKPPPTGRLRRANLHLSYSMTLSRLLDTTPAADITPHEAMCAKCPKRTHAVQQTNRARPSFQARGAWRDRRARHATGAVSF